jgi:sec-independent protein translocase protein TatA
MGALEPPHLIIILVIVLVIFGPGKLPQLGKALGEGIRELKRATDEEPKATHVRSDAPTTEPGASATAATWSCRGCQAHVPNTNRFCGACGAAQHSASNSAVL